MFPYLSDEFIETMEEAARELELACFQLAAQFQILTENLSVFSDPTFPKPEPTPPNEYARKTAQHRSYNPQRLWDHDLYLRSKPPIIRRS